MAQRAVQASKNAPAGRLDLESSISVARSVLRMLPRSPARLLFLYMVATEVVSTSEQFVQRSSKLVEGVDLP